MDVKDIAEITVYISYKENIQHYELIEIKLMNSKGEDEDLAFDEIYLYEDESEEEWAKSVSMMLFEKHEVKYLPELFEFNKELS